MIGALPEPGLARVFKRPEHEFLRIAAMVEPRWETLRSLGQLPGFDWPYLRITALAHQLDGVVAWRLLDERMEGIVPDPVREDCHQYLDYIDGYAVGWRADWELLRSALEAANIEYVQWGGIVPYAEYEMPSWPRKISDIDIAAAGGHLPDVRAIFGEIGEPVMVSAEDGSSGLKAVLPKGTPVYCFCGISDDESASRRASWVFEGASELQAFGCQVKIPCPIVLLIQHALDTWSSVHNDAGPLPVHALARLANTAATLSEADMAAMDGIAEAEVRRIARRIQQLPTGTVELDQKWRALDIGALGIATWAIELADEVYGFPEHLMAWIQPYKPKSEPDFFVWDDLTFRRYSWYRWVNWPGVEAFMFDHRGVSDPRFYVECGLWERLPGGEREVKRQQEAVK